MYPENRSIAAESALKECSLDDPILMGYLFSNNRTLAEHGLDPTRLLERDIWYACFEWDKE